MDKVKLLVSSCLLGIDVKYDGGNNIIEGLEKLSDVFNIYPICPEVEGGMVVPRLPSEIVSTSPLSVQNEYGIEVTDYFKYGAIGAMNICKNSDIKIALLKSNSPSCGNIKVYDGTFSGKLVDGIGITANTLQHNKIKVFNETQIDELYEYIR
ncbi:MAG TPA: DUF523 domain-containing protein [Arcobacter sp.]|nr:DUF523 domain-containing protein [Arcobacter sp.]HIP56296.1 DUF523 domain-containing protein [Arcobacter sp.]